MDPHRSAFGELVTPIEALPREQRILEWRRILGRCVGSSDRHIAELGRRILAALHQGLTLEDALDIRPPAGSRRTAARLVRAERIAGLLVRLSMQVGSDVLASAILRGVAPCPASVRTLVDELRALGAPCSRRAFVRARSATRSG